MTLALLLLLLLFVLLLLAFENADENDELFEDEQFDEIESSLLVIDRSFESLAFDDGPPFLPPEPILIFKSLR